MTNYMALGEYTAYSEQARGVEFYSNQTAMRPAPALTVHRSR